MAHDVFVSHSSKDKPTADAVCAVLESQGIRCWIAPRDIVPGKEWGAAIIEAIKGAKIMVLIFSANANRSPQINKEVERAVNKGIPVIPMRIEDILPTESLEYFLSSNHWLDAFSPPLERHSQHLAQVVRQIIGGQTTGVLPTPITKPELRERSEIAKLAEENGKANEDNRGVEQGRPAPGETESPGVEKNSAKTGKSKAVRLLALFALAILAIVAFAGWWYGVEKPRQNQQRQLIVERAARAKAEAEAARLTEEKRKADELTAQKAAEEKAAQEVAAKKAAEDKAKAEAETARLAEEKRKADELAAQKAAEEKAAQEIAAKKATEDKAKAEAETARLAEERRRNISDFVGKWDFLHGAGAFSSSLKTGDKITQSFTLSEYNYEFRLSSSGELILASYAHNYNFKLMIGKLEPTGSTMATTYPPAACHFISVQPDGTRKETPMTVSFNLRYIPERNMLSIVEHNAVVGSPNSDSDMQTLLVLDSTKTKLVAISYLPNDRLGSWKKLTSNYPGVVTDLNQVTGDLVNRVIQTHMRTDERGYGANFTYAVKVNQ